MQMFKYSAAGNDFVMVNGIGDDVDLYKTEGSIRLICDEYSTDGVIFLSESPIADFAMEFFNPDGTSGMMCGNGGRCVTVFAERMGVKPSDGNVYRFMAADGLHRAEIISREGKTFGVRLSMRDVGDVEYKPELPGIPVDGYFLDTGARHFVVFDDEDISYINVYGAGRTIRECPEFAPSGTNVDFACPCGDGLRIRTYEKGVEAETMACGTGAVACALAAYRHGYAPSSETDGRVTYKIQTVVDRLSVEFIPSEKGFGNIFLTGPVEIR